MHLLVLSAFRHGQREALAMFEAGLNAPFGAQCFPTGESRHSTLVLMGRLNAPFGAQCFPTRRPRIRRAAPTGRSQCTFWCSVLSDSRNDPCAGVGVHGLNAPFGAQCFPTRETTGRRSANAVSMHLLVLSAFRPYRRSFPRHGPIGSQCTFWCSVLSDNNLPKT